MNSVDHKWLPYLQRYINGEWRAPIFHDMIMSDIKIQQKYDKVSVLDIGCGGGFDCDANIQNSIAKVVDQYIGIEPDTNIQLQNIFTKTYRCSFEEAPIEKNSIDTAFAVMVLEHFENPVIFWEKIHEVLKERGVFWGLTVDARHWFVYASILTEKLHIKDWYLDKMYGERGEERYENYGVFYRSNTPGQINILTKSFRLTNFLNFHRMGQMDYYFPERLKWIGRIYDRLAIRMGWPGGLIAVRVEK